MAWVYQIVRKSWALQWVGSESEARNNGAKDGFRGCPTLPETNMT